MAAGGAAGAFLEKGDPHGSASIQVRQWPFATDATSVALVYPTTSSVDTTVANSPWRSAVTRAVVRRDRRAIGRRHVERCVASSTKRRRKPRLPAMRAVV